MGDAQDLALEVVLAAVGGDAELAQRAGDLAAVDVARQLDRGDDRRALVGVAVELEAERARRRRAWRGRAGRGGPRRRRGPPPRSCRARRRAPRKSGTAGVNGRRALALALRRLAPVEVVAAAAVAVPRRSSARWETEANASPGGIISAFCEPATTTSTPHSSCSHSAAPRPETASTTSIAPWRWTTSAIAWTSWTMPVEVSLSVAKTTSMPACSVAGGRSRPGRGARPSPARSARARRRRPRRARSSARRTCPRRSASTFVPGPHEVGDGGLHRARAARREHEHVVARCGRPAAGAPARARRAPRRPARGGRASASAIACETAGGTGVGPAVMRYCLMKGFGVMRGGRGRSRERSEPAPPAAAGSARRPSSRGRRRPSPPSSSWPRRSELALEVVAGAARSRRRRRRAR